MSEQKQKVETYEIGKISFRLGNCVKLTKEQLAAQYGNKQVLQNRFIDRNDGRVLLSQTGLDRVWESLQAILIEKKYKDAPEETPPNSSHKKATTSKK